jgi:Mrp family chromosome partitioning ATPase
VRPEVQPGTLPIHYAELESIYTRTLGNGTRTLAVASAVGGEGTTTLARALAERAAASGNQTLLVDLNLEHPSLHAHYALGRSDWSPENDVQAILPSVIAGLQVLPAPTHVSVHWGFRDPATLRSTLEGWLERFDRVVVDTSPLTRRNQRNVPTDTVCGACGATLLVALAARTPESQLVEARQLLDAAGAELAGAVLNDRHLPGLTSELMRETRRLDHLMPRSMAWLRQRIAGSALLNQPI